MTEKLDPFFENEKITKFHDKYYKVFTKSERMHCATIYHINKKWLFWASTLPDGVVKIITESYDTRIHYNYSENYGGEKSASDLLNDLLMFVKITYNRFILNDSSKAKRKNDAWTSDKEMIDCFIGYLDGDVEEAFRVWRALDHFRSYYHESLI